MLEDASPIDHPAGEWTPDQANWTMIAIAIEAAEEWSYAVFLALDHASTMAGPDDFDELRTWAEQVMGLSCLNLIEQTENMAAVINATREQRVHFIAGRVAVYRARLGELMAMPVHRGNA